MPIWAHYLEAAMYLLFPVFLYLYFKMWMAFSKFNRVFDIVENANSWGRVDELRAINLEIAKTTKRFGVVVVVYLIVAAAFTYLWVVPHAKGLI